MDFKKTLLIVFCVIGLSSCNLLGRILCLEDLDTPVLSSKIEWHLRNITDKKMIFYRYYNEIRVSTTIPQYKDTLLDSYSVFTEGEDVPFDRLWYGSSDSVSIQMNGKIVCVWRRSEKCNSGKQFFNQSSWIESTGKREGRPCIIWTFEILPEDIVSK
jgi:hypothetical protein